MARLSKDYSRGAVTTRAPVAPMPLRDDLVVRHGNSQYDFSRWRKHARTGEPAGRDELVAEMCAGMKRMSRSFSPVSVRQIFQGSLPVWFEYLDTQIDKGKITVSTLADVTRSVLEDFAAWLLHRPTKRTASGRHSYSGARTIYTQVKSVWLECIASGKLSHDCIPDNPFPNSNRAMQSPQPYTKDEMRRLLCALGEDLQRIRIGHFDGEQSDRLLVYLLLVAARTGRNPSPIFEMRRDALQPHPIKPETHALLTTYKRRGNNIAVQSIKLGSKAIEDATTVSANVATLISEVCEMTERLVADAPPKMRDSLWLFESARIWSKGDITCIKPSNVSEMIERFVARHALLSDEIDPSSGQAKPLQVTFMRLRKTFASKMWELTGGDVVRTAAALGNQPRVTDTHYLAVTPEMTRNHRFVGMCLEADMRGKSDDPETMDNLAKEMSVSLDEVRRVLQGKNNTGVGRCSSPFFGQYAPKTGKGACTAFLLCFRCPNQVVMETDLHRLFSFYWLLIKERNILQRTRWHKIYGWVIREIDQVIAPRFAKRSVDEAREEARINPHPMWRDRAMLASAFLDEPE